MNISFIIEFCSMMCAGGLFGIIIYAVFRCFS